MKRKVVQIAITAMLLISLSFTTTAVFAYWREVNVENLVFVQVIGEAGKIIITDLNEELEGQLVPEGRAYFVGDVEEVTFSYDISVSRDLINEMDLIITATNILINDDDTYSHLIDIEILGNKDQTVIEMYLDVVTVTIRVRLIEPIDLAEALELGLDESRVNVDDSVAAYHAIKGQEITFGISFQLRPKEVA